MLINYTGPAIVIALSPLLLHEGMTPLRLAGAVLVVGGAVYGECRSARQKPEGAACRAEGEKEK